MKALLFSVLIATAALSAPVKADTLSQGELRKLFPGSYVVNIFGRWALNVRMAPNGVITGKAGNFADKGRWSIEGNQLCIAWSSWTSGKKGCSTLTRNGQKISGRGFSFSV